MAGQTRVQMPQGGKPAEKPDDKAGFWQHLSVEDAPPIKREGGGRASMLDGTPFVGWLTELNGNRETARRVVVPTDKADDAEALIRAAAKRVGCGVKVKREKPTKDGRVGVLFQAAEKRSHKPPKRGTCPVCGKSGIVVRAKDGMISPHGPVKNRCKGSEQAPAAA